MTAKDMLAAMRWTLVLIGSVLLVDFSEATHCPAAKRITLNGNIRSSTEQQLCDPCDQLFDPTSSFMTNCGKNLTSFTITKLQSSCDAVGAAQFDDFFLNLQILCEWKNLGPFDKPQPEDCGCDFCELLFDPKSDFMTKCGDVFSAWEKDALRYKCDNAECGTYAMIHLEKYLASECAKHGRNFRFPTCECDECVMFFEAGSEFMAGCGATMDNTTLDQLSQTCSLCMDDKDALFTFFQTMQVLCTWKGFDPFDFPICDCTDFCWFLFEQDRHMYQMCYSRFPFSKQLEFFKTCRSVHKDAALRDQFIADLEGECYSSFGVTVEVPRKCVSCTDRQFDVILVVDNSGSIDPNEMIQQKIFVQGLADSFTIADDKTRIGLITYANIVNEDQDLGSENDDVSVSDDIAAIEACVSGSCPLGSSRTNTPAAINAMSQMFTDFPSTNQKIGIVVTDGRSNLGDLPSAVGGIPPNVTMYAIGVINADDSELELIAGSADRVKTVGDFLQLSGIIESLREIICAEGI